jgi:NAD(P)-dependent dehydrogenase (short-subunit alcohol dehydrogenase family)
MMRFDGKVAVVTGAGQGIGEHYARALAAEGASVIVAEINTEQGEGVAASIRRNGGKSIFVRTDVSSEESAKTCAQAAIDAFGGIDLLLNNAAIYATMIRASWMDVDLDYYRKFMSVNMDGVLVMTRAVHASMVSRGGGVVLNQSSTAAWQAGGYYGLAKLGVNGLTIALAKELGPQNIRVNGISPGPTDTSATRGNVPSEMLQKVISGMPIARLGTTQDIVNTALFLLSNEAAWITGQTWCVDGGAVLKAT